MGRRKARPGCQDLVQNSENGGALQPSREAFLCSALTPCALEAECHRGMVTGREPHHLPRQPVVPVAWPQAAWSGSSQGTHLHSWAGWVRGQACSTPRKQRERSDKTRLSLRLPPHRLASAIPASPPPPTARVTSQLLLRAGGRRGREAPTFLRKSKSRKHHKSRKRSPHCTHTPPSSLDVHCTDGRAEAQRPT